MEHVISRAEELLAQAIKLQDADFGNIQIYNPRTKSLYILVHQGFKQDFLDHFRIVNSFDSSACGRAAGVGVPVIIEDVMENAAFEPHWDIAISAGFRSVRSVPIFANNGKLQGIISTHCRYPRPLWSTPKEEPMILAELAQLLARARSLLLFQPV